MKYKKIVDEMAKFIVDVTGSCPYDMYDWKTGYCEKVCSGRDTVYICWIEYFNYIVSTEAK